MRSLITGIHGFVGGHMADLLHKEGHRVFAAPRNINTDYIKKLKPDYIFHLAAQSSNLDSFTKPKQTFEVNLIGTLRLLESVRKANIKSRILFTGSSDEYGIPTRAEMPIKESNELRPQSPYAVSKIGASLLCYQYSNSYGLNIVRVRSFNQEGPGRQERYAISSFCKQIAEIEKGVKTPEIVVGNLDIKRDFIDVRDSVRAYLSLVDKGESGEVYNVCSMVPRKLKDILNLLLKKSRVKDIKIKVASNKIRKGEVSVFFGDNTKLIQKTGWKPKISFEETLEDTLNYWRENLA